MWENFHWHWSHWHLSECDECYTVKFHVLCQKLALKMSLSFFPILDSSMSDPSTLLCSCSGIGWAINLQQEGKGLKQLKHKSCTPLISHKSWTISSRFYDGLPHNINMAAMGKGGGTRKMGKINHGETAQFRPANNSFFPIWFLLDVMRAWFVNITFLPFYFQLAISFDSIPFDLHGNYSSLPWRDFPCQTLPEVSKLNLMMFCSVSM